MSTATMPAPRRITTLQYLRASLAEALGLEPEYEGADAVDWAQELREMRVADYRERRHLSEAPTAVIPAVRDELPALAATPYQLVDVPHLGVLPIGPLEPARLYDALAGGAR